jgi:hypothetical protein
MSSVRDFSRIRSPPPPHISGSRLYHPQSDTAPFRGDKDPAMEYYKYFRYSVYIFDQAFLLCTDQGNQLRTNGFVSYKFLLEIAFPNGGFVNSV